MSNENRLFEDIGRMATGALGALTGVRDEVETRLREQVERILGRMNLVRREEFDAVQAMAAKARGVQDGLEARLAALEARLPGGGEGPKSGPAEGLKRPAPRRLTHGRHVPPKPKPVQPL